VLICTQRNTSWLQLMSESDTLTIRLPAATKKQLGKLADRTSRTKSYLAGEAISAYVARELAIVSAIERGISDMKRGRVVPHVEAMAKLRASVATANAKK
jgi:predicted transcriptional regulator